MENEWGNPKSTRKQGDFAAVWLVNRRNLAGCADRNGKGCEGAV